MRGRVQIAKRVGQERLRMGIYSDWTLAGACLMPELCDDHLILHSLLELSSPTAERSLAGRSMVHPAIGYYSFTIIKMPMTP